MMRWMLPFTASFIRNQIHYHERYLPSIIYLQKSESDFFGELTSRFTSFNPLEESTLSSWLYSKTRYLTPAVQDRLFRQLSFIQPDVIHVHYGVDCILFSDVFKSYQFRFVYPFMVTIALVSQNDIGISEKG